MLKNDYIMKIVEQAGRVLQQVLRRADENPAAALDEIDEALQLYTGLSRTDVDALSAEQIAAHLRRAEMGGFGETLMVAELLAAEATLSERGGDDDVAYDQRLKALELHLEITLGHSLTHVPTDSNIETLLTALDAYELPQKVKLRLFAYYEKAGRLALAEDTLFELLEDTGSDSQLVETGLAFYERLLQKTDYELLSGDLPREEVLAGMEELWNGGG